ncbi:unnamed protein product [Linum tenue]|uniref:non-specific serine/threonine protein kinase n=1 Tax=Linum tenue TaxID=586396 RepID=A0AAV0IHJ2_9ROSI|nr:unnamed protein product [Linum tenue]
MSALGSMSSIAISYEENGPVFCGLKSDGSHLVTCYGSNSAIIYGTPAHFPFTGLTAGDGVVCGMLIDSNQPYCWGTSGYIQMGVPQPMIKDAEYVEISAGDYHLCGLRKPLTGRLINNSLVDCWGYNMTKNHEFDGPVQSILASYEFNCGLFALNRKVFCWGDETSSRLISLIPKEMRFREVSAGGYHVCGISEGVDSTPFCWGKSLDLEGEMAMEMMEMENSSGESTPPPSGIKVYQIAAGNYFTCGILAEKDLSTVCWGFGFPTSLPLAVPPGLCNTAPCASGTYELNSSENINNVPCKALPSASHVCLPCTNGCPPEMYEKAQCTSKSDRLCEYNCSACYSTECFSSYSSGEKNKKEKKDERGWSIQLLVIVAEVSFAVFLAVFVSATAVLYVRYRNKKSTDLHVRGAQQGNKRLQRRILRRQRQLLTCLQGSPEKRHRGSSEKAMVSSEQQNNSKEFHTELDLLSRLNHAHLLNMLGYCEEDGEMLLVYEFMAHGSLHQHLHGKSKGLREQMDWVRRVTIAVQATRGIEYWHGYACPPVIHRDIKSLNILIDEEHNARVADFGLSLLGPVDSGSPLAEYIRYLDPEYYRLHYLTTKSDVYSFGVLLLEILSGRKAIDMQFEIRGKERPSMDKVTTALERALAQLMGSPCYEQPILPTEVVLGSSQMHKKSSQRSLNRSGSEAVTEVVVAAAEGEEQRIEFRAPSRITFPSVTSSQRRKSSVSEADVDGKASETRNAVCGAGGNALRSLEEVIGSASPQANLYLQHNF